MKNNLQLMPTWQVVAHDREQHHVQLSLSVDCGLVHFKGHFPEFGVLPGVVQIDWAIRLAKQFFQIPASGFSGMEHIKFQSIVLPGATLALQLEWDAQQSRLSFSYQNGDKPCSGGRLRWGA